MVNNMSELQEIQPFETADVEAELSIKREPIEIEADDFPETDDNAILVPLFTDQWDPKHGPNHRPMDDPLALKKKRKPSTQKTAKSKKNKSKNKFECPEIGCKYSCVLAKTLKTHRRKHEKSEAVDMAGVEIRIEKCARKGGKLLYKCSRCQTAFLKRASAEAHIASVHMDVKRYTCNACGRGFHRSRDLEEHTRTHTGERPFGCPMEGCDYSSSWCTTVYRHVRRHHKHYTGELTPKAVTKARPVPTTKENQGVKANPVIIHKDKPHEVSVTIEANPDAASVEHITDMLDADDNEKLSPYEETNINDNSGAQYTCNICLVDFEQLLAIKLHLHKDHADVKKRSCSLCGIAMSNAHNLTPHMRIHTGERPFKCGSCEQDFVTVSDLRRHGRRFNHIHDHLMKKWCKCIVCRKSFHNIHELETHVVDHIEDSDVLKADASESLTIYEAVKITISRTSVDSNETYICNICNEEISTHSLAKSHVVKEHKKVKSLSCVYCGFTADSRSILSTHVRTHSDSITFKCFHILCNHATKLFGDHQRHIRNCTKAKDIEILDSMFSQSEGAKREAPLTRFERANISTDTNDKSGKTLLKCTICQAEFDQLGTTREHLKLTHPQIHRYGCPHCEGSFMNAHSLAQHMAVHKEAQPLRRCPVEGCHFTMVTDEDQEKHRRWHEKKSNPRPKRFVCDICGKNFEIKGSLLRHMSRKHKIQK